MPRYFFNLADSTREEDDEGTELSGKNEARAQAVMFLGEVMRDEPEFAWDGKHMKVEVVDEGGKRIFEVSVEARDLG